jgi:hypothetical protein
MTPVNKWTLVFDEKESPKIVGVSLNNTPIAVRSLSLKQEVGKSTILKLEVFIHNDTLETIHL